MIIMIMIIGTDYYDYDYCCYVIYIYLLGLPYALRVCWSVGDLLQKGTIFGWSFRKYL